MSSLKQKDQGLEKEVKQAHYRFVYPKVKIAAPQISLGESLVSQTRFMQPCRCFMHLISTS